MISRPMQIVIVEDNEQLRKLLKTRLEKDPLVRVIEAGTLLEGAKIVHDIPVFVAIVDLDLPDATPDFGASVAAIRMISPKIPIIAITGHEFSHAEAAIRAGATKVIHKGSDELTGDSFWKNLKDAVVAAETRGIYEPPIECLEVCQRITVELQRKATEAKSTLNGC